MTNKLAHFGGIRNPKSGSEASHPNRGSSAQRSPSIQQCQTNWPCKAPTDSPECRLILEAIHYRVSVKRVNAAETVSPIVFFDYEITMERLPKFMPPSILAGDLFLCPAQPGRPVCRRHGSGLGGK